MAHLHNIAHYITELKSLKAAESVILTNFMSVFHLAILSTSPHERQAVIGRQDSFFTDISLSLPEHVLLSFAAWAGRSRDMGDAL